MTNYWLQLDFDDWVRNRDIVYNNKCFLFFSLQEVPSDEILGPDRFYEAIKDGIYLCKSVVMSFTYFNFL